MSTVPGERLSRRLRLQRRIERFLASIEEGADTAAAAEVIVASENRTLAIAALICALAGMTTALVIAYTVGGVRLVRQLTYFGVFLASAIGSASMFVPVPGSLAGITLGLFLDPLIPGVPRPITIGAIVAAGSVLGELTGYSTGVGGRAVIAETRIGRLLVALMRRHGTLTLFCVAAVPNPFIDVGGIAAGVAGMPLRRFVVVMFLGKLVNYTALAFLISAGFDIAERVLG